MHSLRPSRPSSSSTVGMAEFGYGCCGRNLDREVAGTAGVCAVSVGERESEKPALVRPRLAVVQRKIEFRDELADSGVGKRLACRRAGPEIEAVAINARSY